MARITELRIRNLRSLEDVTLVMGPMTVLIGENGSGKSSVVEAMELLRRAAAPQLGGALSVVHGGAPGLLRWHASELTLEAGLERDGGAGMLRYELTLSAQGGSALHVSRERISGPGGAPVYMERDGQRASFLIAPNARDAVEKLPSSETALAAVALRSPNPEVREVVDALAGIEVHPGWFLGALWGHKQMQRRVPMRESAMLRPVEGRAGATGDDLVLLYQELKNEGFEGWSETRDLLRLGLGPEFEDVIIRSDPGGGYVALWLRLRGGGRSVPASALSDGQLAWLAFVALVRTARPGSFLVFDEPEKHLNPRLLARVTDMLEASSETRSVLLSTHSDRLLDTLEDPAGSVVTCELGRGWQTELSRPDPERLSAWLEEYSGYGALRGAGFERHVLRKVRP